MPSAVGQSRLSSGLPRTSVAARRAQSSRVFAGNPFSSAIIYSYGPRLYGDDGYAVHFGPGQREASAFRKARRVQLISGTRADGADWLIRSCNPAACASPIVSSAETANMRLPGGT